MLKRFIMVFLFLFTVTPALAQSTPPDPINAALQDLSNRVNRTVTLSQVTEWNYQQSVYPSPALGCPQPGIAYTDVLTSGYQFIITYDKTVYDYRVSDDKSIVILCGTAPAPASVPPCPPPNDPAFLAPRLSKGVQARVVTDGLPNVIREQPGSSSKLLGQIPPGDTFIVIDGPRCTLLDKIVWWQINYNNIIGWTGEGQSGTYWLEPNNIALTPTATVLENVVINTDNATQLAVQSTTSGPFAIAPSGELYAWVLNNDILVSDSSTNAQISTFSDGAAKATSLAFNATSTALAAGMDNGEIHLFNIKEGSAAPLVHRITAHTGAVTAITFSPDGTLIASAGADKMLKLWNATSGDAITSLTMNTSSIAALNFTPDGINLVAQDQTGNNTLYTVKVGAIG